MTLIKWKDNGNRVSQPQTWEGFSPLTDEWFGNFFGGRALGSATMDRVPSVNIREEDKQYIMELAAPGLSKGDFKLRVEEDLLTISSERKSENNVNEEGYSRREFSYGAFTRSFTLPDTVNPDQLKAEYKDGVLTVLIPKREEAARKVREIKVS